MAAEDDPTIEASGKTLGEARWNAVKGLQSRFPGMTGDDVAFEMLAEDPERVEVRAVGDVASWKERGFELPEEPAERVRAVVGRVLLGLGLRGSVSIEEDEETILATISGEELGLLIGRRGQTIDAIQLLAYQIAYGPRRDRKRVVVDAVGYRQRRDAGLHRAADIAAERALADGRPVRLEPMTAQERRTVHARLADRPDVETHSEGEQAERAVVVAPLVVE